MTTPPPPNWNQNWSPGQPDFTTPHQYPDPFPAPKTPWYRKRNVQVLGGLGLIAVVLAIVLPLVFTSGAPEATLTIHYALIDYDSGGDCSGGGDGYSDIKPGMPVTVEDQNHQVLASTVLPSTGESNDAGAENGCIWTMKVQVPSDRQQYGVTGGRRGTVTFSRPELMRDHWSVVLSIGGDA